MKRATGLIGLVLAWLMVLGTFAALVAWTKSRDTGVGFAEAFFSFLGPGNLETMARQTSIVGFAAVGMTFIIVAGGIDLSVGSAVALVTVVIAWLLREGQPAWVAALGGVLAGGVAGLWNGFWVTRLKVGPFIVTLGSLLILRGLAKGLGNEQKIDAPMTGLTNLTATLGPSERWMLVPPGVWAALLATLLGALALRYTVFGRHTVAIGSNESAARLCGVAVERVKVLVYGLGGLCVGLAGLAQFSRLTVGDPTVAQGLELDVIAAVVIGGGSLSGGEGSVWGSLIGALIMTTIRAGCSQMGLPNWVQEIITGGIIVVAVALDRWRQSRAK